MSIGREPAAAPRRSSDLMQLLELDTHFSPSFRQFLAKWNGGSAYDVSLYGVGSQDGL